MAFFVKRRIGILRVDRMGFTNGGTAGLRYGSIGARAGQRQKSGAIGRTFLGFQGHHALVQDGRQQPPPEYALRAASVTEGTGARQQDRSCWNLRKYSHKTSAHGNGLEE